MVKALSYVAMNFCYASAQTTIPKATISLQVFLHLNWIVNCNSNYITKDLVAVFVWGVYVTI